MLCMRACFCDGKAFHLTSVGTPFPVLAFIIYHNTYHHVYFSGMGCSTIVKVLRNMGQQGVCVGKGVDLHKVPAHARAVPPDGRRANKVEAAIVAWCC